MCGANADSYITKPQAFFASGTSVSNPASRARATSARMASRLLRVGRLAETSIHSARRGNQGARAGSADAVGGQEAATAASARTAVATATLRSATADRRVTGDRMGRAEAGERYRFGPLRRRSRPMNRLCSLLK